MAFYSYVTSLRCHVGFKAIGYSEVSQLRPLCLFGGAGWGGISLHLQRINDTVFMEITWAGAKIIIYVSCATYGIYEDERSPAGSTSAPNFLVGYGGGSWKQETSLSCLGRFSQRKRDRHETAGLDCSAVMSPTLTFRIGSNSTQHLSSKTTVVILREHLKALIQT